MIYILIDNEEIFTAPATSDGIVLLVDTLIELNKQGKKLRVVRPYKQKQAQKQLTFEDSEQKILDMTLQEYTYNQILKALTDGGYPTKKGGNWRSTTVRRIALRMVTAKK